MSYASKRYTLGFLCAALTAISTSPGELSCAQKPETKPPVAKTKPPAPGEIIEEWPGQWLPGSVAMATCREALVNLFASSSAAVDGFVYNEGWLDRFEIDASDVIEGYEKLSAENKAAAEKFWRTLLPIDVRDRNRKAKENPDGTITAGARFRGRQVFKGFTKSETTIELRYLSEGPDGKECSKDEEDGGPQGCHIRFALATTQKLADMTVWIFTSDLCSTIWSKLSLIEKINPQSLEQRLGAAIALCEWEGYNSGSQLWGSEVRTDIGRVAPINHDVDRWIIQAVKDSQLSERQAEYLTCFFRSKCIKAESCGPVVDEENKAKWCVPKIGFVQYEGAYYTPEMVAEIKKAVALPTYIGPHAPQTLTLAEFKKRANLRFKEWQKQKERKPAR